MSMVTRTAQAFRLKEPPFSPFTRLSPACSPCPATSLSPPGALPSRMEDLPAPTLCPRGEPGSTIVHPGLPYAETRAVPRSPALFTNLEATTHTEDPRTPYEASGAEALGPHRGYFKTPNGDDRDQRALARTTGQLGGAAPAASCRWTRPLPIVKQAASRTLLLLRGRRTARPLHGELAQGPSRRLLPARHPQPQMDVGCSRSSSS